MGEVGGANVEIAHKLSEGEGHEHHKPSGWTGAIELIEAVVLALVAIATAMAGYQAAQWDGHQDKLYANSTKLRVEAEGLQTRSVQEQMYDGSAVAEWIKAEAAGNQKVSQLFERRMRPEFRPAFESWKKLDPINNPDAPAGPILMPEYRNAHAEESRLKAEEASALFEEGAEARHVSDKYVRASVALATVLLLTAIAQRFKTRRIRIGLAVVAFLLLCVPLYRLIVLPHRF